MVIAVIQVAPRENQKRPKKELALRTDMLRMRRRLEVLSA